MQWLLKAILGTKNERDLKKLRPYVGRINEREKELQALSDDALKAKTQEFRERAAKGETLDDLMVEAFAVVKNACRRLCGTVVDVCGHPQTWGMVPFAYLRSKRSASRMRTVEAILCATVSGEPT